MIDLSHYQFWFVTGSQHLYGRQALEQVAQHAQQMAGALGQSRYIPAQIVQKPVVSTPEEIYEMCMAANADKNCAGLILWMHTFSPAKMWIAGLNILKKPFLHLHTQFNRDIPWGQIDMDFMNLNQSAHGDREFGFMCTRMRLNRKVVVGHWQAEDVQQEVGVWVRAACAWQDAQQLKVARFGDNMREVAVTEGDKVEAQMRWGYSVYGYGVGELVKCVQDVPENAIKALLQEYEAQYALAAAVQPGGAQRAELQEAARLELGMRAFLDGGGFKALTTTFEDLYGLAQLPGLACQRLMADGYGFGAEGDWKTAALVRAMKVMSAGLEGGTSFMEDYTYHLDPAGMKVLGAHMLEVCPSIAEGRPSLEVHPLSIGGKADPPRLVFNVRSGPALNASLIDLGDRFRLLVNEVDVLPPDAPLEKLPVARAVWVPRPNLKVAAAAWIYAGGAHHTGFSQAVTTAHLDDFANIAGVEMVRIDQDTRLVDFRQQLRWNEAAY